MEYALLGSVNIKEQLDSAYWINIQKFNEAVTKNSVFELALRGHDETQTSDNPGIFRGLINFTAELDKTLAQHLEESTVFKGISKEIQNDILDCMLELWQDKILEEIGESPYLAVMADETTDISAKLQMVVVFRYCRNGAPVGRFWTYLVPSKLNADTLSKNIFSVLDPILENSNNKLIAQSYDGAAVMCGQHAGVQARIKEKYPFAHFVHCYAHQLNLIMSKACSENSQIKSSKRKFLIGAPTRWNFNIRTVNVVFEHRSSFIECMEEIEESFDKAAVCSSASSIRRILVDQNFVFWLTFFHRIMPQVDVLYNALQKSKTDPLEINKKVTDFERYMNSVRNSIDDTIDQGSSLCVEPLPTKRLWKDNSP
ncbi:zinc finger MYM-type protein 1-like, partial [Diabrotica undecimpunctata]|uniref:zinc finger MYM-type protein 1-like n=1 Tax=Diabrotica undecimpunctata TaxID=50387 RepID=UPI003B63DFCA